MTTPQPTSDGSADALPTSWQRLLALSGIAFAVLFLAWRLTLSAFGVREDQTAVPAR